MNESEDLNYSDSHVPNIVGYIRGMLDTLSLFFKKEWYRQYCAIDFLELPVENKDKIVQERADGVASKLVPTDDHITGVVETLLQKYFDERYAEIDEVLRSDEIKDTWGYLIWRIAEYIMLIEERCYIKSCLKEKSIIKTKGEDKDGIFYCLTIDYKFLVLIKIHDVRVPQEETDDYLKFLEENNKE